MQRDHATLKTGPLYNDLAIENNSLVIIRGAQAIGQHAQQRLGTFAGEWFLDKTIGVPWIQQIFARGYQPELAEAIVKGVLAQTDGVTGILGLATAYDRLTRGLIVEKATISTVYEEDVTL